MSAPRLSENRPGGPRLCLGPALAHLALVGASVGLYKNLWRLDIPGLQPLAGLVLGPVAFAAIGAGALVVYPVCRRRGAGPAGAAAASLAAPLLWIAKEAVRVGAFFTWPEALYYTLSSACLLALAANIGCLGAGEMIHRWGSRRYGEQKKVITFWPAAAVVLFFAALFVILIWGLGVHWFYIYQEGYKALFH